MRRGVFIQGLTSADMRNSVEAWFFRPLARYLFHIEPRVHGLVLGVTEYFNDNWDQVYVKLLPTCDPRPRWPESYTLGHTHAELTAGLTAHEQEQLIEDALQTLFGVDSASVTDAAFVQWRFAFEAVIPEGNHADLAWAEQYVPYLTASRQDSGELAFHRMSGLARAYAENQLSLLSWRKGASLERTAEPPPVIAVPQLVRQDWIAAVEALVQVESWECCLRELYRSANMVVAFVQAAQQHGRIEAASLLERDENELLKESLRHLFALFEHAGLLAPQRDGSQPDLPLLPSQLRLYGSSPAQRLDFYAAMYIAPLERLVERHSLSVSDARQVLYGPQAPSSPPGPAQNSPAPKTCPSASQRVTEILSMFDRSEDFAAPLNGCLAACAAYLKQPTLDRVWEIASTLPNLQFLLEVLGVEAHHRE